MSDLVLPFQFLTTGKADNSKVGEDFDQIIKYVSDRNSGIAGWDKTYIGTASTTTGILRFYNSASTKYTGFQAGNALNDVLYTLPTDAPALNNYVLTSQTTGVLTWAAASTIAAPSDASYLVLGLSGSLSAERVLTAGTAISFSDTGVNGTLTINNNGVTAVAGTTNQISVTAATGSVTFSTPQNIHTSATPTFASETLTAVSNQLVLGTTRTVTLTAPTPASTSRVITFPDLTGDYSVVGTIAAQTIAGAKTFSSGVVINPTTNQLILGVTNTTTISATAPASSSVYTIQDVGTSANFILSAGTQTIGGSKTFSSAVAVSATSNHLVLSTASNTLTINANSQASARIWSVPDISGAGTFAALEGTQTFSGSKTFSSPILSSQGSVSAPGVADSSHTGTGIYFGTNTISIALNGVQDASFNSVGTADDTDYLPLRLFGGGGSVSNSVRTYTTTSVSTAKAIASPGADGTFVIVSGNNGTNYFVDLVLTGFSQTATPTTVASNTILGTPATRTYSMGSNQLKVAMSTGTYSIHTLLFDVSSR